MNLIVSGRHYPISLMRYWKFALEKLGHKLYTVGNFYPSVPWRPDIDWTPYWDVPDFDIQDPEATSFPAHVAVAMAKADGFNADGIVSVDAGFYLENADQTGLKNVIILTDPHALKNHYLQSTEHYNTIVSMQHCYRGDYAKNQAGGNRAIHWIPYAADSERHYWAGTDFTNRPYDITIVSALLYPERLEGLAAMEYAGINVHQASGLLFDEYTKEYQKSVMAFTRSGYGKTDLPARFWEGLAMRCLVVVNRLPDLEQLPDLVENRHYVTYESTEELVDKVLYYSKHRDEAFKIASAGYAQLWASNHFYTQRAQLLLDVAEIKPYADGK